MLETTYCTRFPYVIQLLLSAVLVRQYVDSRTVQKVQIALSAYPILNNQLGMYCYVCLKSNFRSVWYVSRRL